MYTYIDAELMDNNHHDDDVTVDGDNNKIFTVLFAISISLNLLLLVIIISGVLRQKVYNLFHK